ncbi:MAG: hypothetical protein II462_06250 [Muribaculaceae bacterium]|nr:hypothetical protein [Muribaculaceae bacterium]
MLYNSSGRWGDKVTEENMNEGNFVHDRGYWKLLIDRRRCGAILRRWGDVLAVVEPCWTCGSQYWIEA